MSGVSYIRRLSPEPEPWYVRLLPWAPAVLIGVGIGLAIALAGLVWVAR
jgi:hypothetical protein